MKVYKYRSIDERFIERDLKTFSQNKFFASTFENLNDPFEANYNELITESTKILEVVFKVSAKGSVSFGVTLSNTRIGVGFDGIVRVADYTGLVTGKGSY